MSLSGVFGSRRISRICGIALALSAMFVVPACWVSSINPLYDLGTFDHPHNDTDMVFDPSLIGSWTATDDKCTTLLTITADDPFYDLRSSYFGEGCGEDKSHYHAILLKLDSHYFLDLSPVDGVCDMCLAMHEIFLANFDKTTLSVTPIDSDWLKRSLDAKKVTLATLENDSATLAASSKDLKAFCREFAESTEVFKPGSTETLKRK